MSTIFTSNESISDAFTRLQAFTKEDNPTNAEADIVRAILLDPRFEQERVNAHLPTKYPFSVGVMDHEALQRLTKDFLGEVVTSVYGHLLPKD